MQKYYILLESSCLCCVRVSCQIFLVCRHTAVAILKLQPAKLVLCADGGGDQPGMLEWHIFGLP